MDFYEGLHMTIISETDANTQADFITDDFWGVGSLAFDVGPGDTIYIDILGLTAEGQLLAKAALDVWAAYTGINFVYGDYDAAVWNASGTQLISYGTENAIIFDDNQANAFAGPNLYLYDDTAAGADNTIWNSSVNISTAWLSTYGVSVDSYSFQTYLHEIGHALGLGHAGYYDASEGIITYDDHRTFDFDSWQMTVMSYFDQIESDGTTADFAWIISPMMADIIAMQNIYGIAGNIRTGDNTYGSEASLTQYGADFAALIGYSAPTGPMAATIMDDGGIDTFDFSSGTDDQEINLASGGVSSVYGIAGNVVIFHGTVIENVLAGSGDDTVYGNAANNNLNGGLGNDTMYGYGGSDTMIAGGGFDYMYGGVGTDYLYGAGGINYMYGGSDDDYIYAGTGTKNYAYGDAGADRIYGNAIANNLFGGADNDIIKTGTGSGSVAYGGTGDDYIYGGSGISTLYGDADNDYMKANAWAHTMYGGTGTDRMFGGSSTGAILFGDDDTDLLYLSTSVDAVASGGNGIDRLYAQSSDGANFYGGSETAFVYGGTATNLTATGGSSKDYFYGGSGTATLLGDGGNDNFYGGSGSHDMFGGTGIDRFYLNTMIDGEVEGDADNDYIYLQSSSNAEAYGGDGVDRLYGNTSTNGALYGDDQTDYIYASSGVNLVGYGGNGGDYLYAGDASQVLYGDSGNDRLYGTSGDYDGLSLYGGTDSDFLFGGDGDEFLYGGTTGTDADRLYGGNGDDWMYGNGGNDKMYGGNGSDNLVNSTGFNTMYGGANQDNFLFYGGNAGTTIIRDFQDNIDTIRIDSALSGGMSVADFLTAYAVTASGNTYINVGGVEIRILGVDANDLLNDLEFI
jgi:serralysin